MKQSRMSRFGIAVAGAAFLFAVGSAAAQVTSPGNNKSLPALQAEIAALNDRVRKLEGNLTEAEVQGGYALLLYQTSLGANGGNTSFLEHAVSAGTLQLNAGGAMAYEGTELKFTTGWTTPGTRTETDRPDGFNGSWDYVDGVLVLTIGAERVRFVGGVGGRLFATVGANGLDGSTTLVMLVKNR